MIDLYEELKTLILKLNETKMSYAMCGGLALAIYGIPRATIDIDLLVPIESLEETKSLGRSLGYTIEAKPMTFANGAIEIHRLSKVHSESGDILALDLLLVTPQLVNIWESRQEVFWENGSLWVVSRDGLIALKSLRGSGQDLDDIKKLKEEKDET